MAGLLWEHNREMKAAIARRTSAGPRRRASEIIEAAAEVFDNLGYHGASTQDIADVLGIRQASLYYYFQSKEDALDQVCLHGVTGVVENATSVAAGSGSAAQRLHRLIRGHIAPMLDRPAYVRVFVRERRYLPDGSRRRVGRLSRRYERIFQSVIEDGVAAREFRRNTDCRLASLAILGMCNGAVSWYGKEPGASVDRIADALAEIATAGLLVRLRPVTAR